MDTDELLKKLSAMDHPNYGHLYVEWGGIKDYRSVGFEEGQWYYSDGQHSLDNFYCSSLHDALECIIDPPTPDEWADNLQAQREEQERQA